MTLDASSPVGSVYGMPASINDFVSLTLRLEERSDIGGVLVNCAVDTREVIEKTSSALGMELPDCSGRVGVGVESVSIWLTPRSWLVLCAPSDEDLLVSRVNVAFADKCVHAAAFSDYLAWFALSGAFGATLLTSGGFLSLEPQRLGSGQAKRTLLAGIPVIIYRSAEDVWLLGVERSRVRYFVQWLGSAAAKDDALRRSDPVAARRTNFDAPHRGRPSTPSN